jgi:hypothetical protein
MNSSSSSAPTLEARLSPVWRVELSNAGQQPEKPKTQGPAAQAAAEKVAESKAQLRTQLLPGDLLVEIDVEAGRFVQTLRDANSQEVVWRYPNENQLAFSRAVKAYQRAISGS